jgi:hypothetical protein
MRFWAVGCGFELRAVQDESKTSVQASATERLKANVDFIPLAPCSFVPVKYERATYKPCAIPFGDGPSERARVLSLLSKLSSVRRRTKPDRHA